MRSAIVTLPILCAFLRVCCTAVRFKASQLIHWLAYEVYVHRCAVWKYHFVVQFGGRTRNIHDDDKTRCPRAKIDEFVCSLVDELALTVVEAA